MGKGCVALHDMRLVRQGFARLHMKSGRCDTVPSSFSRWGVNSEPELSAG